MEKPEYAKPNVGLEGRDRRNLTIVCEKQNIFCHMLRMERKIFFFKTDFVL
ncbi:hypothetical protein RJP21_29195 [Paenibacillus sp. VCA1]|uniref:hypothetical protein n=1 Tax=Paenibacillus sp. VCA1 TaxID=3039148 RepID=UPI0028728405|nr:hypothetical protein [Paenibacillus sp. VCA1]MDR9857671.1 hypothetical protein [Paenibacillus sp. VCA1]